MRRLVLKSYSIIDLGLWLGGECDFIVEYTRATNVIAF